MTLIYTNVALAYPSVNPPQRPLSALVCVPLPMRLRPPGHGQPAEGVRKGEDVAWPCVFSDVRISICSGMLSTSWKYPKRELADTESEVMSVADYE